MALHTPVEHFNAPDVLIESVLFDGYAFNDADEAVRIVNVGDEIIDLNGWWLSDGGSSKAVISESRNLMPGEGFWLTKDGAAFRASFGREADYVPERWPGYANNGDEVLLFTPDGQLADALVYLGGSLPGTGWTGPALAPYQVSGVFATEGQILYRLRDPLTGRLLPDTDTADDWAQMLGNPVDGRKVRYPGWQSEKYYFPLEVSATSTITVAVAPDNAYETLVAAINRANESIELASLTLDNLQLGDALATAAARGVRVRALLEGGPPGGLSDAERAICRNLEAKGGECWFMINDPAQRIYDRYTYMHAKYVVIDSRIAVISTENFSPNSMPTDDKSDGTLGRRGVVLLTDAPAIASHLLAVFADDIDPVHSDIQRWSPAHPIYGDPPTGYIPPTTSGGTGYEIRFPVPVEFSGDFAYEFVQVPENALRSQTGLLHLIDRAGVGDRFYVQQLSERPYWGATSSNPTEDPNPRLEALIAAARRGATVQLLLDSFFDNPTSKISNRATCEYVNAIASREALSLKCSTGNPTGLGIHNKMVLAWVGGHGYVQIGSINGTELSHKGNREIAIQIQSDEAYTYLARVFASDLGPVVYFPLVMKDFSGGVDYLLISEIVYDTPGPDEAEFVEIVNPTGLPVDLTGYALGDAVYPTDFEDRRFFPPGATIEPGKTLVVALSGRAFRAEFGFFPDFEIIDTEPSVPDMIDDPSWGDPKAIFRLGNSGDEVILWRDDVVIDVVTYGNGSHPQVVGCPLLVPPNRTLERYPYWRDSDNCPNDFRPWPFPSPGRLP